MFLYSLSVDCVSCVPSLTRSRPPNQHAPPPRPPPNQPTGRLPCQELCRLRDEADTLSRKLGVALRRSDEDGEVAQALKAQLVDFKAMVQVGRSVSRTVGRSVG